MALTRNTAGSATSGALRRTGTFGVPIPSRSPDDVTAHLHYILHDNTQISPTIVRPWFEKDFFHDERAPRSETFATTILDTHQVI